MASQPEETGETVAAPLVGVFYAAPAPEEPPYVTAGAQVKKGDTLCIIEAMKLMNDVVAEEDGEVVEICAEKATSTRAPLPPQTVRLFSLI